MDDNDSNIDFPCPTDLEVALEVLFQDFPKLSEVEGFPSCALQSQILALLKDNHNIEREIRSLTLQKTVRRFRIVQNGVVDYVIVKEEEFRSYLLLLLKRMEKHRAKALEFFLNEVLCRECDVFIEETTVRNNFGEEGLVFVPYWITVGVCIRRDEKSYWLSMPNIGIFLKHVREGRKEILNILRRNRYHEMSQKTLEQRRLKRSCFSMKFHLREMIGNELLERLESPVGTIIRLNMENEM